MTWEYFENWQVHLEFSCKKFLSLSVGGVLNESFKNQSVSSIKLVDDWIYPKITYTIHYDLYLLGSLYTNIVSHHILQKEFMSLNAKLGYLYTSLSFQIRLVFDFIFKAHHALGRTRHFSLPSRQIQTKVTISYRWLVHV